MALLASVLLHELGHALVARRFGIGVRGITLELLGGYTELDRDAPSPQVEVAVSLAGPAVSLALGVGAAFAAGVLPARTLAQEIFAQAGLQQPRRRRLQRAAGPAPGRRPRAAGRHLGGQQGPHLGDRVAGWVGRAVAAASLAVGALLLYAAGHLVLRRAAHRCWSR